MINFVPVLANILKKALETNKEDPEVKTADPVVFEELKKKFEKVEPLQKDNREDDILEMMKKRVEEAKVENEVNPEVETAPRSVYENIMKELEKLKNQSSQSSKSGNVPPILGRSSIPPVVPSARDHSGSQPGWEPPVQRDHMRAMTNSGGSLQIRQSPDMGAAIHQTVRIPDQSMLTILEYSNNQINLDGKMSRFALVEYNGVRGWILESYLNFN